MIFMLTIPIIFIFSFFFMYLSHPLAMGLVLFIQTTLISITIGISNFSFWFSYILFLVFLGGYISIIYLYCFFSFQMNLLIFSLTTFIASIFMTFMMSLFIFFLDPLLTSFDLSSSSFSSLNYFISTPFIINWVYNTPSMIFTIFIISYLLLMLIIVVKIINLFKGPLRLIL
uniref:NADH dehydrogenase subunit 6 n=1 Tax=Neoeriocheir leptognathus TaxID=215781 RepID=A0A411IFI1_9EUCA|nr:NADH dehydrogenase subunit 6 [Neoeriocheir leptognathus]QBB87143.1 NADH dehydrogenase subunit 6 [Neoeriocheir leptognathus]